MAEVQEFDVVVIGAGPGGYAAAFHAAELGLNTAMVNAEERPGGVCLLRGCIPSKALLHIAKLINESRESKEWGVTFSEPQINLDRLREWKEEVVKKLSGGIAQLGKGRKVTMLKARASFKDSNTLALNYLDKSEPDQHPGELRFKHCIIATGSRPAIPKIFDISDERVMDSTGALDLPDVPKRMLVVGGGYIGLEMGTVYAALGSKVTVVEMTDGLLPGADRDLVRPLEKRLQGQFEAIKLNTKVEELKSAKNGIIAKLSSDGKTSDETFDRVLISIGRRPNSEDLGLENTQVQVIERGFIRVDDQLRTDDPNIWAIGDVAGEPMLAHKASHEAKIAAEVIAGHKAAYDVQAMPAVVFTDPEIAWAGLTEAEARSQGLSVKVAKFPWGASGRATTLGRNEGLTKLIIEAESDRVLGVGLVGVGAGDMIAEGVLAIEMGSVVRDLADSIHPHPTLSETMMEAAEVYFGTATHIIRARE